MRNVLAHLEELGLLHQPHTSAGRVPTDAAYRLYVDDLLRAESPDVHRSKWRRVCGRPGRVNDLLENVSHELSRASHQVGFALTPSGVAARLRHIDFVRLEGTRVLVIVVSTAGQITHKVVDAGEACDSTALSQAANYINAEFAGLTLDEVRAAVEERMHQERMLYDALAARALRIAQDGLGPEDPEKTLHVQGASRLIDELLGAPADRNQAIETMRVLIRMIEEKDRLIGLLARYMDAPGLTIVIGAEHGLPDLRPFSLVASTFCEGNQIGAAVGVIGPTRMRYQRAISAVDTLSTAIAHVLEGQYPDRP